jgi:predicted SpoU family rRNA methylase
MGALLARAFGAVEPVGQHEQAKDHEHDDKDVFDFHGGSFVRQGVGLRKTVSHYAERAGLRTGARIKGPMAHRVSPSKRISMA